MAPETRSKDVKRMDDSLEAVNQRINGIEVQLHAQSDDLAQLKTMMKEIATQQQTLQTLSGEANSSQNREMKIWALAIEEGRLLLNDSDLLNCTQTLELKSSAEPGAEEAFFNQVVALSQMGLILLANAKKNAIYVVHLDYGPNPASTHLDYISEFTVTMPILSLTGTSDVVHGQSVAQVYCVQTQTIQQYTLELCQCLPPLLENMDALCCRFGGQKDPLEELTEHKQEGDLEGYSKGFDELWNRAQISEKQALVFFLGGGE